MADRPPSLAEKVRFWQEQDQINQQLIPRVIELHEQVVEISKRLGSLSPEFAAAEARTVYAAAEASEVAAREAANAEIDRRLKVIQTQFRWALGLSISATVISIVAVIILLKATG